MIDFVSTLIVRFTDYKSLHTTHIPSLVYDLWMKLDQISLWWTSRPIGFWTVSYIIHHCEAGPN